MYSNKSAFPIGKILAAVLGLALCFGLYFGVCVFLDPYGGRIAEGVCVGGLELGGMTKTEARKALQTALDNRLLKEDLSVKLPKETLMLSPEEAELKFDTRRAVNAAYRYGRKDAPGSKEIGLLDYLEWNEAVIRSKLEEYAEKYDTELAEYACHLEGEAPELASDLFDAGTPGQTLVLTRGVPEVKLNVDELYQQILQVYAGAAVCKAEDYHILIPKILPQKQPAMLDLGAIYEELTQVPVDDSLDLNTYRLVPGSYGYTFDQIQAGYALTVADPGETVYVPMEYVEPSILGEEVYFRDVLGHCETKHNTDENRNTNLRLLCQALDGVILQPGEEFSYNGILGERTAEKGYKPATAYSGTRMIKDIGGGVCQGSTTIYNCALLADLEILERVCHGASVTYIQPGLDAAVNWNTKTDLRFRNNFHFPMMIRAEVSDGYVRMKILGTDEKDYYIKMSYGYDNSKKDVSYAVSYKNKYDKATNELISKDREAYSVYYKLS